MSSEKPLVYVILGAAGSGRREVLADLLEGGLAEGDRAAVLLSTGEAASEFDARLGTLERWTWSEGRIDAMLPAGATHVFFVTDGRTSPIDQIEALHPWIAIAGGDLARVITVVNCRLAEKHAALLAWYEACIHFSDVVLLHQREGVANKWMSDFQTHFKGLFYPCLFEVVKTGRVKNPLVVLDPQARRMSHLFDLDEWSGIDLEGVEFGTEDENGEETPAKKKTDDKDGDDDDWMPEIDPYLEREAGSGRRVKEIPEIGKYLQ